MSSGQWANFATSGLDLSASGSSVPSLITYSARGIWDPVRKQMSFYGQSHSGGQLGVPNVAGFVRWDEATNTWYKENYASGELDGNHAYHHLTVSPSTGHLYLRRGNQVLRRDPGSTGGIGAWELGHVHDIYPGYNSGEVYNALEWFRS
jgi:hypothetical protein